MNFSSRYIITLFASFLRAGLNFVVSIMLARYLMPESYGNYQYITAIITSILVLSTFGTEKAYFTFISQKSRPLGFHVFYYSWQLIQLLILVLLLSIVYDDWLTLIFGDTEASLILIALIALFFSSSIQTTIGNLFESLRKTMYAQVISVGIAFLHLLLIYLFISRDELTIELLFIIIALEYLIYLLVALFIIKVKSISFSNNNGFDIKSTFLDFYHYSRPLAFFMLVTFFYTFYDRWLIQTYVGAEGQAFFSIAIQFSTLSILVTSSILKIFWKEISEAISNNEMDKVKRYFIHISNGLFLFTTVLAVTLYLFSNVIIHNLYGESYINAQKVFQLIMLYTIPQSLGQLYATYFLATSQVKRYTKISLFFMFVSFPIAFLLLSDFGLELDEDGIATKMLILSSLAAMVSEYFISKHLKIPIQLMKKIFIFVIIFLLTYLIHSFVNILFGNILIQFFLVFFFYILPVIYFQFQKIRML